MTFEMYMRERLMDARTEGIETGRTEGSFQMVKNFLLAETPIEYIKSATGWSEEKILQFENSFDAPIK